MMTFEELEELLNDLNVTDMSHDVRSIEIDYEHGNVSESTNFEQYRYTVIVRNSLINGQKSQAKRQCDNFGLEYSIQYHNFKVLTDD